MTGRSVVHGAFLLSLAGIACKILGAAYRIPLVRMIGDEGIGLYQMAYPIYLVFMALSTAGMPLAISKLVAERTALADGEGSRRILRLALAVLGGLGLSCGAAMAGGARFFAARIAADPRAYAVILSLAPAVPLMALMAALRGFFQGGMDMLPSAVSQMVEQAVRVATLLILASILLSRGVDKAAAGAAFGASAGGAAGLALLCWWYFRHPLPRAREISPANTPSYPALAGRLFTLSLPIAFGALLLPLMQGVDSFLVPTRLQAIGFEVGRATAAIGQLGNAWAVVHVPTTFTGALAVSLVPSVAGSWAKRARGTAVAQIRDSLRLTILVCLPSTVGLMLLPEEICRVLYGSASAAPVLQVLAPAAFFLGLQGVCGGALQGLGRTVAPMRNFALGFLVKAALTGLLCGIPTLGPRGAALATVCGAALAAILNLREIARQHGLPRQVLTATAAGAGASAAMAFLLHRTGGLLPPGAFVRLLILIPLGMLAYVLFLRLLGGIDSRDVELLRASFVKLKPAHTPDGGAGLARTGNGKAGRDHGQSARTGRMPVG